MNHEEPDVVWSTDRVVRVIEQAHCLETIAGNTHHPDWWREVLLDACAALRASSPALTTWQPIATAPKDGTKIVAVLVHSEGPLDDREQTALVFWDGNHWLTTPGMHAVNAIQWIALPERQPIQH